MHIEPGLLSQGKIIFADAAVIGVLGAYTTSLVKHPLLIARAVIAAFVFTLFMSSVHMPVGPSELHFVGAMVMYLTLGFLPTLFGFALGLGVQAFLLEPSDAPHLAVNTLSLILPLMAVHYTRGRMLSEAYATKPVNWQEILKLDALYYIGVTLMVGAWLSIANIETPLAAWATFASSYLAVLIIEPVLTYSIIHVINRYRHLPFVEACFAISVRN